MADPLMTVEVVHAAADRQSLVSLRVARGCTARQAVADSGLQRTFPELDLAQATLGIFGKVITAPESHVLEDGDRVEVYRPLLADPKDIRKRRAALAARRT